MVRMLRWGWIGLAAALVFTACGDDKKDDTTPPPNAPTETAAPTTGPTEPPPPTHTPYVLPDQTVFDEAAETARADLAARLDVSITQITALERDTSLFLEQPLLCPEITDESITPQYLYLQHERLIYPYQFYAAPDAEPGDPLTVEACDDTLVDEDVLFVPTPDARADILDQVRADLTARGIDPAQGSVLTVRGMTWMDSALGCRVAPEDQDEVIPQVTDGYLVVYEVGGVQYEYHTDKAGTQVRYCEQPIGYASIEAFIYTLNTKADADLVEMDETARYDGLDADGVMIGLTPGEYRVGLFDFETPQAVRDAAALVDDPDVSHIYVSGYVLIVQEENALAVNGILAQYAELVRSPVLDRQEAELATQRAVEATEAAGGE